ncbi:MAG: LolA family protein [Bryobacteraceae bacterium]
MLAANLSCISRTRVIARPGTRAAQPLLTAQREELLERITKQYAAIGSLSLTVDMAPLLGSAAKGKITEYQDVRGYLLYRAPSSLRLIGLYPVVRTKAFDMVTDGTLFRLYLPALNRFVEGPEVGGQPSAKKIENLRPLHFLEALNIKPVDPEAEKPVLHNLTDEKNAAYVLDLLAEKNSALWLKRQIWFDRLTLRVTRQILFDERGDILTDARYSAWRKEGAVEIPGQFEINRPKDEYGVVMKVTRLDLNPRLGDEKFALDRPAGVQVRDVGVAPAGNKDMSK